jgi:YHS domain-containing protein
MSPRVLRGAWLLLFFAACPKAEPVSFAVPPPDGTSVVCPVTRTRCEKGTGTFSSVLDERTYYFCAEEAWARFQAAPERFRDRR